MATANLRVLLTGLIALLMIGIVGAALLVGREVPSGLWAAVGAVVTFYFTAHTEDTASTTEKGKGR